MMSRSSGNLFGKNIKMSTVKMDMGRIEFATQKALYKTTLRLVDETQKITPRDPKRPPNDPEQHVTGNLKRSIWLEKVNDYEYKVGTQQGDFTNDDGETTEPESYAPDLEFWTEYMKPRSFIRQTLVDKTKEVTELFSESFNEFIKN